MKALALLSALLLTACGGSASPVAPTPRYPDVAGQYRGTITLTFPDVFNSITCPASTSVTQAGSSVSIAPMIFTGACEGFSIPFGPAMIDETGALIGGVSTGTFVQPSCGSYLYNASGGFFGRDLRMSMTATSRTCVNFNFTAVLTR